MRLRNYICIALLLFVSIGFVMPAMGAINQKVLDSFNSRPQLSVEISQRNKNVLAPLDVYVRLINLSDKDIFITRVSIQMPSELLLARGESDLKLDYLPEADEQLTPGTERNLTFTVPNSEVGFWDVLVNYQLLTFFPSKYDLRAVVSYTVPPQKETQNQEIIKLDLEPPLGSLVWGGIAGSLLLSLFILAYRFYINQNLNKVNENFIESGTVLVLSIVSSIIIILLLHRIKDLSIPINIAVNDFYGAIIIGLFTVKLGDWLFRELFTRSPAKTPEGP